MTRSNRRAMFRNGQMMVFVRKLERIAQSTHLLTNQLMFSLVFDKSAGSLFVGFGLSRKDHSHHDGYITIGALKQGLVDRFLSTLRFAIFFKGQKMTGKPVGL